MVSKFGPLFSLNILHDFYSSGLCEDFSVTPVRDTALLLKNHQAVFRFTTSIGSAVIKTEDGTPVAAISEKSVLEFSMNLLNPSLLNVTSDVPAIRSAFLYTNSSNVADGDGYIELQRTTVKLCGNFLSHYILSENKVTLILTEVTTGKSITFVSKDAGSQGLEHVFDLQHMPSGLYQVAETSGGTTTTTLYYADKDVQQAAPFGIIRLVNQPAFPFTYNGNEKYTISLSPASSTWNYYVVAPNLSPTDIGNLNILDQGRVGDAQILFDRIDPDANDQLPGMLAKDATKVALFRSKVELTWQQAARKQIELRKNSTTLIDNLPNPDMRKPGTNIYIYV